VADVQGNSKIKSQAELAERAVRALFIEALQAARFCEYGNPGRWPGLRDVGPLGLGTRGERVDGNSGGTPLPPLARRRASRCGAETILHFDHTSFRIMQTMQSDVDAGGGFVRERTHGKEQRGSMELMLNGQNVE
jgi:hypothetical protein